MKELAAAAKRRYALAFETAIKNCIHRPPRGGKLRVDISEADSQALVAFYMKHVNSSRDEAITQVGLASRRAAGKGPAMSVIMFVLVLCVTLVTAFGNVWPMLLGLFAGTLAIYLFWNRRRTAQKLWASRRALPRGTEEALEKMCVILDSSPFLCCRWPIVGGLAAAAAVCVVRCIMLLT
ncbi:MAG: hypothetical protein IKR85_00015 [Clostridia bacterium]|nr:hypothetical protein [Clostridia bacterium]